jgi:TRAP-type C4-dicarboxylate transport system permease small subunit
VNDPKLFASLEVNYDPKGSEGPIEKICKVLCVAAIVVMLVVIGEDIVSRGLWNSSLELSDEIGGYMLVAITFLGLAVVKTHDGFHRTDYIQSRLPPKARIVSSILFDLLALGVALILLWQYFRFTAARFEGGNTAPTRLATQQWIPAVPMVLGMAAYVLAIVRSAIGNVRKLKLPPPEGDDTWDSQ